ncbi:YiiX/YebB-like N1pC/P60 family cysteine hydrolase [Winogradskyella sp.]|uniref:YiiX/YebB-like N1pC/P60 family cysteine hydrolase n=1 Tax=Winogradskyella sp. TaxID=1883156 RepID=UPI00260D8CAF|nr:YiiX/YebB-like N1pC/P60 family cysteine hydrolase [Winogradskyella sp.]
MKNTSKCVFALVIIGCLFLSCNQKNQTLQEGDLLFQDLDCGDLCDAIETVTIGVNGKDFSHCGMVIKINDTLKVIEAIGEQVQVNTITTFLARSGDTEVLKNTTVARVKPKYKGLIPKATSYAIKQTGQPYDHEFILDNGSWYCSELLYEAFKQANNQEDFFELAPMTYKDPRTKSFFPAWVSYYNNLNKDIPEGKLGLNPGSISRSNNIDILHIENIQ